MVSSLGSLLVRSLIVGPLVGDSLATIPLPTIPLSTIKLAAILLGADAPRPLIERLDPERRAAVMAALAGLIFLAFALMAGVWLWGQWLRRRLRKDRPASRAPLVSDWDRKQPVEDDPPQLPGSSL
jgi:hypothetical protein